MPCVFPILSLKALKLAKAGGDEHVVRRDALAYTAGIVLTCLALGGALLALRAGGAAIGWAFQLQDPRIILLLLVLVTAIAFNLAGLFELSSVNAGSSLAEKPGSAGSFWTGVLAAFIATPCTGPFMGAAMGAALILTVPLALVIFAGLGLGLALPFLLISFIPALRRGLPKPGPWMGPLRRVLAVPMFLTAIALVRSEKPGSAGSFWTGVLAAFIATPCTGPFMGAAMGAALILPVPLALVIFAGLGLGLALPFLLIAFIPALRRGLPKPGPWMGTLRRVMAVPMFLTAIALVWLLGRQAGTTGMTIGLGVAAGSALLLWWVGMRQAHGRGGAWIVSLAMLRVLAGGAALLPMRNEAAAAKSGAIAQDEAFSEARLAALRAEGRPVFLYFTADWCLTCKANEAAAIDRAEVRDAFARKRVAMLVGDWTNADPEISRFLERHGRSGVPLYLWYAPGQEARVLPQILTPSLLATLPKG